MINAPVLLLVGGTGFVGRHLAEKLTLQYPGHRRVVLMKDQDNFSSGWEVVRGDLLDPSSIDLIVSRLRPEITIHLAAQASIDVAVNAAEMTWRVNFGGTLELASAVARHAPASTFFFTSSAEVYGKSFVNGPADESTLLQPNNAYAASKMAAEYALMQILPAETRLIIARAFNHTGPGQDERFALPSFAAQIARIELGNKEPVIYVGDLVFQRDFLHVSDVVAAYIQLLTASVANNRLLVNVCSGHGHVMRDLLDQLCAMSKSNVSVVLDPARLRPNGLPATIGDPTRLKTLTGWEPKWTINNMLLELLDYWRARTAQRD
ncbi:MAG: epimerase [Methylobacterium sp.]|nr:MAG: epimerase [Methylobacterium sp.]